MGNMLNEIAVTEHRDDLNVKAKRVVPYGIDSGVASAIKVDSAGNQYIINASGLVPDEYDYIALTYVAAGNGAGEIETAIYKTGGSGGTTIATLTLAYNSSNEISSITKT